MVAAVEGGGVCGTPWSMARRLEKAKSSSSSSSSNLETVEDKG